MNDLCTYQLKETFIYTYKQLYIRIMSFFQFEMDQLKKGSHTRRGWKRQEGGRRRIGFPY